MKLSRELKLALLATIGALMLVVAVSFAAQQGQGYPIHCRYVMVLDTDKDSGTLTVAIGPEALQDPDGMFFVPRYPYGTLCAGQAAEGGEQFNPERSNDETTG